MMERTIVDLHPEKRVKLIQGLASNDGWRLLAAFFQFPPHKVGRWKTGKENFDLVEALDVRRVSVQKLKEGLDTIKRPDLAALVEE